MAIQRWVLLEPTHHRPHHAPLTAPTAARHHASPQGTRLFVPPQQQPGRQTDPYQQRHGHSGKQPRPRGDRLKAGRGHAQPPGGRTEAGFAPGPAGICRHGLRPWIGPMGHPIPEAPLAMPSPLPTQRAPQRFGGLRTIAPRPQEAPARLARHAQRLKLGPHPCPTELAAWLDAKHPGEAPLGPERDQRHVGAAPVGRHPDPTAPPCRMTRVTARRLTARA
jgi:hypothetical protein